MSFRYPGGFIVKNPVAPTSSAARGIWTMDQAAQNIKDGNWPLPGINYSFTNFTFTPGWSQTTIDTNSYYSEGAQYSDFSSAYSGATFLPVTGAFAVPFNGIQVLTLPAGTYTFDLYGASQVVLSTTGQGIFTSFNSAIAYGARIQVPNVVLDGIKKVTIIIGQSAQPAYQSSGGYGSQGGSGATWLFLANGSTLANLSASNLIAVAGGAGGFTGNYTSYAANASYVLDGSFNVSACAQDLVGSAAAGTGGNGGTGGNRTYNLASFLPGSGGGGAGVSSNGGRTSDGPTPRDLNGSQPADFTYYGRYVSYSGNTGSWGTDGQGGFSPSNGAQGGMGYDDAHGGGFQGSMAGGFGGGGGGSDNVGAGGGGGGYNGGVGGTAYLSSGPLGTGYGPGSGGSSFVASTWRGTASGTLRTSLGNGQMIVTKTA